MTKQSYFAIGIVIVLLSILYVAICLHPAGLDMGLNEATESDGPPPPPPPSRLSADTINKEWKTLIADSCAPAVGNPRAAYTAIEVGDFQCPQCGKMRPIIENLVISSQGNLKLYFLNFPLQTAHPHALFAAQAALAAAKQGKFWQMYDLLYTHQDELIPSEIQYYSGTDIPGFNETVYLSDVNSPAIKAKLKTQIDELYNIQIDATPTLLLRKSSGGTPAWYIGSNDLGNSLGITHLAANPPWNH
jgi:protein-disulfide isomerase